MSRPAISDPAYKQACCCCCCCFGAFYKFCCCDYPPEVEAINRTPRKRSFNERLLDAAPATVATGAAAAFLLSNLRLLLFFLPLLRLLLLLLLLPLNLVLIFLPLLMPLYLMLLRLLLLLPPLLLPLLLLILLPPPTRFGTRAPRAGLCRNTPRTVTTSASLTARMDTTSPWGGCTVCSCWC